jgi:anthranilate phosphoribosyltransferase
VVIFNAAASLLVAGAADGLADGVTKATNSLDSGRARQALDRLLETCGR